MFSSHITFTHHSGLGDLQTLLTGSVKVWLEELSGHNKPGVASAATTPPVRRREERGGWRNQYQTGDIAGGGVVVLGSYQCNERETMERLLKTGGYKYRITASQCVGQWVAIQHINI